MEQKKLWDYYQAEGKSIFGGSYLRLHFLASRCKKKEKVLNIGIGGGLFEKIALHKGLDIYSLDPSENAIEELTHIIGIEKARVGFSNKIPFLDNFFDVVIMSEVLEHLEGDVLKETFHEVYRVLRKGGRFMGTVPNDEVLSESIIICPGCGNRFHRWGHLQQFNKYNLREMLQNTFLCVSVVKRGWLSRERLNVLTWIYSRLNDLLYKLNMRRYKANLFFCCKK